MKIGWYIRVSTQDQKDGLEFYHSQAKEFCDRYNHTLIEIFSDEDVSGGIELFKRPSGKRLHEALKNKQINAIASPNVSRLFRDLRDGINTIHHLGKKDVTLYAGDGYGLPLDVNTPMGFSTVIDQLKYAHFERLIISDRTTKALAYKRKNGFVTSHVPYGYDKGEDNKLTENITEMKVVKLIIKAYNQANTLSDISNSLNENKLPTKKGGKWYAITVSKIISYQRQVNSHLFENLVL